MNRPDFHPSSVIKVLFLILLLNSCTKKDNTEYINPELKKHFSFTPGTYWIYRDSLSGTFDTFTVHNTMDYVEDFDPGHSSRKIETHINEIMCNNDLFRCSFVMDHNAVTVVFDHLNVGTGFQYNIFDTGSIYSYVHGSISIDSVAKFKDINEFWIKKDLGFVKIHLKKDSIEKVWELEQWKLNE